MIKVLCCHGNRDGYLGNSVLICQDVEEEPRCRLSLTVCDWTVTVHHQILLDPGRQVFLPTQLQHRDSDSDVLQLTLLYTAKENHIKIRR